MSATEVGAVPDRTAATRSLRVAIVMPAYNAAHHLRTTIPAARAAAAGEVLLVVDPGSTDETARVAEELGATVLRLGHRAGPAEARNAGVAEIDADVALFIDSDCVAHRDVVERVRRAFEERPDLVTLTGSYDDTPPDPGFFSQYMNLRHHHTHQLASQEPASFWAGCGAVRVDAFRRCGGFDAQQFPEPMIEDIELGMRMRTLGATRLDPALHVTHLKRWTLASVVLTDVLKRALPWSRLLARSGALPNDLNLRTSQRVAATVAPFALLGVAVFVPLLLLAPSLAWLPCLPVAASISLNGPLLRFLSARRGIAFAVGAWLFHQVHLTYSAVTFALVSLEVRLRSSRRRDSADFASSRR